MSSNEAATAPTVPPSSNDPRFVTFSTLASGGEDEEHLLSFDYNELPTYPVRPSYKDSPELGNIETHVVAFDPCAHDPYHPSSMPIYQTATFVQPSIERFGPYDYTRSGNPTRTAVEELVASLEGAHAAFAFNSGMAAISAVSRLLPSGSEILCGSDVYGGSHRLFTRILSSQGVTTQFVDTSDIEAVKAGVAENTKCIYCESPSNPMMQITDLRAMAEIAHQNDAWLVVDATMMSPYLIKPLLLGADVVIQSATKFLTGHSDTMGGFVCCSNEQMSRRVAFLQNAEGSALCPFDSWLTLRGLKTLSLRQERAQQNAMEIAQFLAAHPLVTVLHYAAHKQGVRSEAEYDLHRAQARGGGSVISFETGSVRLSRKICDHCKIHKISVSFGSCNSLIEMPCVLSHASISKDERKIPEDIVRLSVGVEHIDDLLADLSQAMKSALKDIHEQVAKSS